MRRYLIILTVSAIFIWACGSGVSQVEYDDLRDDLTMSKVALEKANTDLATKEAEVSEKSSEVELANNEINRLRKELDSYKLFVSDAEDVANVLQYWSDSTEVEAAMYQLKAMQILMTEGWDGLDRLSDDELEEFLLKIDTYPMFEDVRINNSKLHDVVSKQEKFLETSGIKSMVSGDALMDTLMEELSEEEMVQLDVEVYRVMINMLKK